MKIKMILFDLIGTTVLEKDPNLITNCFKQAFKEHGVRADEDVIRSNRGKDKMKMIDLILQNGKHSKDLAPLIFESFKRHVTNNLNNFEAADDVKNIFNSLKKMRVKIGLGTGLPKDKFDDIINHLGWSKSDFQYIGISGELGKARPDPVMIFDMMRTLKISDCSTILKVGDTIADIEEGKNAGVKTVVVLSGTQNKDKIMEAKPDFMIEKISSLIEIVKSI